MDEDGVESTASIDRVPLAPCNGQGIDQTDRDSGTQNANYRGNEDRTDGIDACIVGNCSCYTK